MRKPTFIALISGTVSTMLFAIGMCMALLPEWDAFGAGVVLGILGIVLGIITLMIWRRMTGKAPVSLSLKSILAAIIGIIGALVLGVGMCFSMVWGRMAMGIIIGLIGIMILISLVPILKGIED